MRYKKRTRGARVLEIKKKLLLTFFLRGGFCAAQEFAAEGDFFEAAGEFGEGIFDGEAFEAGCPDEPHAIGVFVDVSRVIRRGDGPAVGEIDKVFADFFRAIDDRLIVDRRRKDCLGWRIPDGPEKTAATMQPIRAMSDGR